MSKGLLAFWRRRIVSRGLAGAALFAIPVAVAALIGFGTSLSGVAGGLTAVTSGPDAVPASVQTTPSRLNDAVVALADRPTRTTAPDDGAGNADVQVTDPDNGVSVEGNGTDSNTAGTSPNADIAAPTVTNPVVPNVTVPGTDGTTTTGTTNNAVNQVNGTVDNLLSPLTDTLNSTLNGLLGNK